MRLCKSSRRIVLLNPVLIEDIAKSPGARFISSCDARLGSQYEIAVDTQRESLRSSVVCAIVY
jgi:hypothetical protein